MFLVRNDDEEVSLFDFLKVRIDAMEKLEQGSPITEKTKKQYLCFWLIFFEILGGRHLFDSGAIDFSDDQKKYSRVLKDLADPVKGLLEKQTMQENKIFFYNEMERCQEACGENRQLLISLKTVENLSSAINMVQTLFGSQFKRERTERAKNLLRKNLSDSQSRLSKLLLERCDMKIYETSGKTFSSTVGGIGDVAVPIGGDTTQSLISNFLAGPEAENLFPGASACSVEIQQKALERVETLLEKNPSRLNDAAVLDDLKADLDEDFAKCTEDLVESFRSISTSLVSIRKKFDGQCSRLRGGCTSVETLVEAVQLAQEDEYDKRLSDAEKRFDALMKRAELSRGKEFSKVIQNLKRTEERAIAETQSITRYALKSRREKADLQGVVARLRARVKELKEELGSLFPQTRAPAPSSFGAVAKLTGDASDFISSESKNTAATSTAQETMIRKLVVSSFPAEDENRRAFELGPATKSEPESGVLLGLKNQSSTEGYRDRKNLRTSDFFSGISGAVDSIFDSSGEKKAMGAVDLETTQSNDRYVALLSM